MNVYCVNRELWGRNQVESPRIITRFERLANRFMISLYDQDRECVIQVWIYQQTWPLICVFIGLLAYIPFQLLHCQNVINHPIKIHTKIKTHFSMANLTSLPCQIQDYPIFQIYYEKKRNLAPSIRSLLLSLNIEINACPINSCTLILFNPQYENVWSITEQSPAPYNAYLSLTNMQSLLSRLKHGQQEMNTCAVLRSSLFKTCIREEGIKIKWTVSIFMLLAFIFQLLLSNAKMASIVFSFLLIHIHSLLLKD